MDGARRPVDHDLMAGEFPAAPMTPGTSPFAEVRRMLRSAAESSLPRLGAGVYVLLWLPILNTFFLPVAIVAGTCSPHALCGILPAAQRPGRAVP